MINSNHNANIPNAFTTNIGMFTARALVVACMWISSGCKKFVEVPAPIDRLVTTSTFSDDGTATAAMTSIYSQILANGESLSYSLPLFTGYSSDELQNYSSLLEFNAFYQNSLTADGETSYLTGLWNKLFNLVYQSNAVIEGVEKSTGISAQVKKQLTGEAKFVRAFLNFYLLNLWGDIPLIQTTSYTDNAVVARKPTGEIYNEITKDLLDAQQLLSDTYVDQTSRTESLERVRPNKASAEALLARVYIYLNNWPGAEELATQVIENPTYELEPDLNNVFLKTSREAVWQIMMPQQTGIGSFEAFNFILSQGPETGSMKCSTISEELLNAFEPNDQRRSLWIDSATSELNVYYYPFKYKTEFASEPTEYTTAIRLSELFLIRAEARINQDRIDDGLQDLNKVRNRAGLIDVDAVDKITALQAVYNERRVELFAEWGHRWFDLKRTSLIDSVMSNIATQKGTSWTSYKALFPIPQAERDANASLSQNPGY